MDEAVVTLIHGDAADMACVGDGEAALVITSPPYFPPDFEDAFSRPRRLQRDVGEAWARVEAHARGLRPAFSEMARVVGRSGLCCIESKDVVFGDFRLPLAALHATQAREQGLWPRYSLQFRSTGIKPSHLPSFVDRPVPGSFRTLATSTLLVCSRPEWRPRRHPPMKVGRATALRLIDPSWRLAPARRTRIHEHQSPPQLIRRLILLLTVPGDLVVDPFAGSGQALSIARGLGRRAIGYERDPVRHERALDALLERTTKHEARL